MLRHWILTLVYAIRFIPGSKNYADILTKPLSLDPFKRFRDSILTAQIILPDSHLQSGTYCSRISAFLAHLLSLPDGWLCLCGALPTSWSVQEGVLERAISISPLYTATRCRLTLALFLIDRDRPFVRSFPVSWIRSLCQLISVAEGSFPYPVLSSLVSLGCCPFCCLSKNTWNVLAIAYAA